MDREIDGKTIIERLAGLGLADEYERLSEAYDIPGLVHILERTGISETEVF